ncbi:MAG: hypothetical protein LWX01_09000 [Deltaproteobacteria bacterium]|nr:hypothetical protein [Deltaproteobacteria bacterium]MDL1961814.1 hypothetical protein [Deltaproteobacteria bacterium]
MVESAEILDIEGRSLKAMGNRPVFRILQAAKAIRMLGVFPLISLLPLPVAYSIATWIGTLDSRRESPYIKDLRAGLKRCFPYLEDRPDVLRRWLKNTCCMQAREMLDAYVIGRQTGRSIGRLSEISGRQYLTHALENGRGVIIVLSHYSRLNMLACTLGLTGQQTGILTQAVDRRNPFLDWVDRTYLRNKLRTYYRITKGTGVTLEDDLRGIYRALKANEAIVILLDAYNPRLRRFRKYPFLGGKLYLPTGIERISVATKAALVYGVVKENGWRVKAEIRPLPGTGAEAMLQAVRELEQDVSERPWEWWQWGYMNTMWYPVDFD